MGCSLSAASDMAETRSRLDREARANDNLKHYYMLIHSLKRKIADSRMEKNGIEKEATATLSNDSIHDETFIDKMRRFRRQIMLNKADQEMYNNALKEYVVKILELTECSDADSMDIQDVAKSGYYSSDK